MRLVLYIYILGKIACQLCFQVIGWLSKEEEAFHKSTLGNFPLRFETNPIKYYTRKSETFLICASDRDKDFMKKIRLKRLSCVSTQVSSEK